MDEGHAFDSRLAALRERGFEVVAPTGELASQEMLYIEEQADLASTIKSMVLDLPPHWDEQKHTFLTRLINPLEAASVEIELRQLLRHHRPWVLLAERVRGKWSEEGRTVELSRILERLDAVDDAIVMGSPRILSMIEDVSPMRNIEPILVEIERRNLDRLQALQGMMEMLSERGWDISSLHRGTIYERFEEAERIHSMDDVLSRCQRKIENGIRPFGHNIAERMWGAISSAQKAGSVQELNEIESEIDAVYSDLNRRFEAVESRIASWQSEGFQVDVRLPLLASEMIHWEQKIPTIAENIEASHAIWAQMEVHLVQWPEFRRLAERTRGHLDALESLDVLLQGLVAKTEAVRDASKNRLELWSRHGIDTSTWSSLIESEPRGVLEELDTHQPFIDLVIPLIEQLQSLDTSIDGSSRVAELLVDLRSAGAGLNEVELARDWLQLAQNRRIRHREYLDRARIELATLWPANLDPNSLNLSEYEQTITDLESHGTILSESKPKPIQRDPRLSHLIEGLKGEIDDWRFLGWSVDGLLEMLAQDPVKLGLDLPGIRAAMSSHEQRIKRLEPLPWGLDIDLAERVLSELRRPECLVELDEGFQTMMQTLANAEGTVDPDFEFVPFIPNSPYSTIEKRLPVLVPMSEEVVETQADLQPVEEVEVEISENEVEMIDEIKSTSSDDIKDEQVVETQQILEPDKSIRTLVGVGESESWEELFSPPLDVRVQRLIRLALLLEGTESNDLNKRLARIAKRLEEWTAERLSRRHASSGNGLLKDAKELGMRLADIPGPGAVLPLSKDEYPLPKSSDLRGIEDAIHRLEKAVILPSAMVPMAPSIES